MNLPQAWDLATRRPQFDWFQPDQVRGHAPRLLDLAWSPDTTRLLSADDQGRLGEWDAAGSGFVRFLNAVGHPLR